MKALRVAVIGAGYWGPNLVRNLSEAPGAEPVAVADLSDERLETIHKRFPAVRTTKDHRSLFADPTMKPCASRRVGTHRGLAERPSRPKQVSSRSDREQHRDAEAMIRAVERAQQTSWSDILLCTTPGRQRAERCARRLGKIYYSTASA